MPETPFVSVIVPTHGRPGLLARLLDTLLDQDWPSDRYEIIVVHNVSADDTEREVLSRAEAGKIAMRYFRTTFKGPGPSRQYGADHARGDILAFIDDDCVATPGWIAAGAGAIADGLALAQGRTIPHPGQPRQLVEKTVVVEGPTLFFETCNIFYETAAFRAVGGFPVVYRTLRSGEDTSLGWAMRAAGYRTGYSASALVYHEVFRVTVWRWLRETFVVETLPQMARDYPGFRDALFLRHFLSPQTAAFDAYVLGVVAGLALHWSLFAACLPYLWMRLRPNGRFARPDLVLLRFVCGHPRAAMIAAYLIRGSIRARSVVL